MLSPLELTIIIIVAIGLLWWWRIHGQRDYALRCIKQHCEKLNLTLLDGYVALKAITFRRDGYGKLRFARIYSFEFTVTGEQRYTGTITLFGYHVGNIELPPYPFNPQQAEDTKGSIVENRPHPTILTLDDYKKRKNTHEQD